MKGDFSRIIFDSRNHYAGVLQQEGRVWLDSDWNESVQEQIALMQSGLNDMIGPSGMATASAFQIAPATAPSVPYDFQISAGRAYVNGLQGQLDANTSYLNQPDFLDPVPVPLTSGASTTALVYLEVWQRLITSLEDNAIREPALGGPDTSARIRTVAQVKVVVLPSGTTNITADQAIQFLPTSGQGVLTTQISSRLSEDHLYRVQVHDPGDVTPSTSSRASITPLASDTLAGSITLVLSAPLNSSQVSGALRTGLVVVSDLSGASERVAVSAISADGTTITLSRPLTNSYTVGNAAQVSAGIARVKWSRNNAAFAASAVNVQPDLVTLSLANLGRDSVTVLRQGDVVEITDDASELGPGRGHLTTLASDPDPDLGTVVLTDPLPQAFKLSTPTSPPSPLTSSRHLVLRRWDGATDATGNTASDSDTVRSFGDGVQIVLGGSDLRAGDYWQFTSRAVSGSVQTLFNALPAGVTRYRTPLAVVVWLQSQSTSPPGGFVMTVLKDCRKIFQPLSNAPQPDPGIHISGIAVVDPASGAASPLLNDSNVPTTSFGGINVTCDGPVSFPSPAICVIDVESPVTLSSQGTILPEGLPGANIQGYFETPLTGTVASQGNVISWRANPQTQGYVNRLLAQVPGDRGILTRVRLNGNFIWSLTNSSAFLDGEAFASHARVANQPGTGLVQISVFGTGVSAQGVLAADGLIDGHYKLVSSADPNSVATDAFVANSSAYPIPPWIRNGPNSK